MLREEEKALKRAEGKSKRKQAVAMDVHMEAVEEDESSDDGDAAVPTILSDPRFINVGMVYGSKDLIVEFGSWYWRIICE